MAIEDGLRSLYLQPVQPCHDLRHEHDLVGRAILAPSNSTNAYTALAVLAIQNHGHPVNGPATDIFQPVVQNGLNWLFDNVVQRDMTPCSEAGAVPALNPCVAVPAPVNTGLSAPLDGLRRLRHADLRGGGRGGRGRRAGTHGGGGDRLRERDVRCGQALFGNPAAPHQCRVLGPEQRSSELRLVLQPAGRQRVGRLDDGLGASRYSRSPRRPGRRFPPR